MSIYRNIKRKLVECMVIPRRLSKDDYVRNSIQCTSRVRYIL